MLNLYMLCCTTWVTLKIFGWFLRSSESQVQLRKWAKANPVNQADVIDAHYEVIQ